MQKLTKELKDAQEKLAETEEEQRIKDIENALDQFLEDLQDWWDNRLNDIEWLLQQAIDQTNLNSQKIWDKIQAESTANSDVITQEMQNVWTQTDDHMTATDDILSSTTEVCNQIESDVQLLPTQDGLENYLTGQNLQIVSSIYGVENAVSRTDSSIQTMNSAVGQIHSNIVEYENKVLNAISSAASAIGSAVGQAVSVQTQSMSSGSGDSGNTTTTNLDKGKDKNTGKTFGYKIDGVGTLYSSPNTAEEQLSKLAQLYANTSANSAIASGAPSRDRDKYYQNALKTYFSNHKVVSGYYKRGGVINNIDNPFDLIAKSLGEDHMVAAKEGERILTPEQNKSFEKLVDSLTTLSPEALEQFNTVSKALSGNIIGNNLSNSINTVPTPNVETNTSYGNITTDVGGITLNLPNVTNKDEFVGWLKNDAQVENIIQSMTLGRMMGKNSYSKMKY